MGQVEDAETASALSGAHVLLLADGDTTGVATDDEGQFRQDVSVGTYRVTVTAVGYEPAATSVRVRQGQTSRVTLRLVPQTYSLNEIVVEDREGTRSAAVSTVQRIAPQAIERQDAADVSELAELVPATHVQTNSRGQTILYFRNAGDRQVGQFFDGALLNIPWDNRVDISLIPASVVEEVTVTKGVPSIRYGANVLGGAINFQSRTLDAPGRTTELKSALGTAGQKRAAVTHLGRTETWDYTTAVQYSVRGNQPLPANADLTNNQPLADRRVNTDRQILSGFGRASRRFDNGGQFGVSVLHVDAEQGVAPEGNVPDSEARYWRYPLWQKSTVIASGQVPLGTSTAVRGAAWGSRFAQDIAQYRSVQYRNLQQLQKGRDITGGIRIIGTQNIRTGALTLAVNGLTSRHEKRNQFPGSPDSVTTSTFRQNIFSTGLEYEVRVNPRVQMSAGVNIDGTSTPETGPFPERDPFYAWGMTSGLRVDLSERWALRGAAGRKSRFPTMRELFGAALGKFVPNPNLRPVTAWIGEVGIERESGRLAVGATPFYNRVFDTIDKRTFQSGPNEGKEQRINLKGARIYGVETTLRWAATDALLVDGNLTWSRPRSFTDDGTRKLDEKPAWLGTGTLSYDLPFDVSIMGQVRYTDGIFARNEQNQFVSLPGSLILDARLSYALSDLFGPVHGELYARADNLTDDAKFIGLGLPGPGRSFRVGLNIQL